MTATRSPDGATGTRRRARAIRLAVGLAAGAALAAAGCSGSSDDDVPAAAGPSGEEPPASAVSTGAPTTTAPLNSPLTGLPLPAGLVVADRPAVAVKIDNAADAEPQAGLEAADLVFEERVEGITRLLAVFWSRDVERVGPIRSARTSDIDLLGSLGRPLLAWSGGNEGVVEAVAGSDAVDVGVDRLPILYERDPDRIAPHNLMSDTAALREASAGDASLVQAPLKVAGADGRPPPAGSRRVDGAVVDLDGLAATWAWDPAVGRWLRFQRGGPHLTESGEQISAANVVVLEVDYTTSAADADSPEAVTVGDGPALVLLADGTAADVSWERADGRDPFVLRDDAGNEVALLPGTTWIELPRVDGTSLLAAEDAAAALASR